MARKNLSKPKQRKKKTEAPRFDMDLFFEKGYEAKVLQSLQSNKVTRKYLGLIEAEQDRGRLILLLSNVVFCQTQHGIKTDTAAEVMGGDKPDNIENVRRRIIGFAAWLRKLIRANYDLANDNTIRDVIPMLRQIAKTASFAIPNARRFVKDRNWLYVEALCALARFMEEKAGKPRYADMARLLEASAHALGKRQTYNPHTILVRIKAHRSQ